MALYALLVAQAPEKEEWRCAMEARMAQSVMTSGMSWRPEWSAGSSDTMQQVCE